MSDVKQGPLKRRGSTLTENVIIISLIAIAMLPAVVYFAGDLKNLFFGSSRQLRSDNSAAQTEEANFSRSANKGQDSGQTGGRSGDASTGGGGNSDAASSSGGDNSQSSADSDSSSGSDTSGSNGGSADKGAPTSGSERFPDNHKPVVSDTKESSSSEAQAGRSGSGGGGGATVDTHGGIQIAPEKEESGWGVSFIFILIGIILLLVLLGGLFLSGFASKMR